MTRQKWCIVQQKRAAFVFEQELGTKDYRILGNGVMRLYKYLEQPETVISCLVSKGIGVKAIEQSGDNLEDYFLKLTGGELHV